MSTTGSFVDLGTKALALEAYRTTGKKFTDETFLPVRSSLIKNWSSADHSTQRSWRYFNWKRISEIYEQQIKVFDVIEPNDIQQGAIGNCYFLSALAALAEFPTRIQRLFDTQEYEAAGVYAVYMCDVGEIKAYVVDDYFPISTLGKPAFSGPKVERGTSELWVVLLEKAWAKRFGCYYAISEGVTNDVLRDFTGAPCEDIPTHVEELWSVLVLADAKKFIITASSGEGSAAAELGLINLHAYSVIRVDEVPYQDGFARVLQIRNPWGGTEWTGDWSDASALWTDELKKQLGWTAENDGTFWMNLEDFKKYFTTATICAAQDNFIYTNIQATQAPGGYRVFEVELQVGAELFAIVTQLDSRRFERTSGYEYSTVRIIGAYKNSSTGRLSYLGGRANTSLRDVWEEFKCPQAGTYVFYVQIEWIGNWTDRFGFSIYSSTGASITDASERYGDFSSQVYNIESAREHGTLNDLGSGILLYTGIRSGTFNDFKYMEGYLYDAFENTTPSFRVNFDIVYRNLSNLELLPPFTEKEFHLSLGPGESAVVVKRQVDLLKPETCNLLIKKQVVLN
jgi:calpain-15